MLTKRYCFHLLYCFLTITSNLVFGLIFSALQVAALFHDHPKVPEEFVDFLLEAPETNIPHFEQSHGLPAVEMFSVSSMHDHNV